MKTNYQSINKFEVAIVSMIMIGFVLIGSILFIGLTPRSQNAVASSVNMFDIHEPVATTVSQATEVVASVMDVSNEFYNQFYIAFTEVATLPSETFESPTEVATELYRNVTVAINNLTNQVSSGYLAQNHANLEQEQSVGQGTEVAFGGQVLGAVIEISDSISTGELFYDPTIMPAMAEPVSTWDLPYRYEAPDMESLKLSFTKLINQ